MNALTPETILKSAQDFMESRILLTAAEMNLFTMLGTSPRPAEDIAVQTGSDLRALTMLLDALVAMGYISKKEGLYHCEESVYRLLSAEAPGSVLPMVRHMASLWPRSSAWMPG